MTDLLEAFRNTCLQQRRLDTKMSIENFRKTLVQLFSATTEAELENLAIDVEDAKDEFETIWK